MTTPATKTVKVDPETHQRLKVLAAKNGEHVYELVRRLAKEAMKNGSKRK